MAHISALKYRANLRGIRAMSRQVICLRRAMSLALILFAVTLVVGTAYAGTPQMPVVAGEIKLHSTPDETSPLIETVREGGILSSIAETTNGGARWFMVKTKNGNIGWMKADDNNAESKRINDHFRALPKETISVELPNSASESATTPSQKGVKGIPILVRGPRVYVSVIFNKRVRRYLLVDTGAYQTTISKRVASEVRVPAVDRATTLGVAGSVTHNIGLLESIRVGPWEMKNFPVNIFDHTTVPNDDGLLGFDFLGAFEMSIDPEKQEMTLTRRKK